MAAASASSQRNTVRAAPSMPGSSGSFHSPNLRTHSLERPQWTKMSEIGVAWDALRFGGAMVYPLLALGVLAIAIIMDRAVAYFRCLRMPAEVLDLVETYGFSWDELDRQLHA